MHLRNVTTAFLMNGDDILMMKRSERKRIGPGYWYGVGGHLEPQEFNDPRAACLREIGEETGIGPGEIHGLSLRYIVMRRSHAELVINYFYFGWTDKRTLTDSEEGTLHWIPRDEALNRQLFPAIGLTLKHFLDENRSPAASAGLAAGEDGIQLGLVAHENGVPVIRWNEIMDWADPA